MGSLMEFKCPNCDASIHFDSGAQKMKCPYCGTELEISALKAYDDVLRKEKPAGENWEKEAGSDWQPGEKEGMVIYSCKSCGGEILVDKNTAATSCPFCGNTVIMPKELAGDLRPDWVVPFKYDKNSAKEALRRHMAGKKLLPKVFKDENHIDEIKGLYVPFWLYDCTADAHMRYQGATYRSWSDGSYNYRERQVYAITREGTLDFHNVPVDGSSNMPDELMESIEPYDFKEAVDFQAAYLAGYLASRYDEDAETGKAKVNKRIQASTTASFDATVRGFSEVTVQNRTINLIHGKVRYALLPVWMLNTTWRGARYTFVMNGQSGKFAGDLPVDQGAYWRWFGMLFGIVAVVAFIAAKMFL